MPIKEWTTTYPTTQDPTPVTGVQPSLVNESALGAGDGDNTRVSQIHSLRDKLDAVCKRVGDDSNLPVTSLLATRAEAVAMGILNGSALYKYDALDNSVIDPTIWTQEANNGAIAETTYLELSVAAAVAADWTGAVPTSPLVRTTIDYPRDWTATVHVTIGANNDEGAGITAFLTADKAQRHHVRLKKTGGNYVVEALVQSGAVGNSVVLGPAQNESWLLIGRRGNAIISGLAPFVSTSEIPHNLFTYLYTMDVLDWTPDAHFGNSIALVGYNLGTLPGVAAQFRKFRQAF